MLFRETVAIYCEHHKCILRVKWRALPLCFEALVGIWKCRVGWKWKPARDIFVKPQNVLCAEAIFVRTPVSFTGDIFGPKLEIDREIWQNFPTLDCMKVSSAVPGSRCRQKRQAYLCNCSFVRQTIWRNGNIWTTSNTAAVGFQHQHEQRIECGCAAGD
jgi:hypothetical protein